MRGKLCRKLKREAAKRANPQQLGIMEITNGTQRYADGSYQRVYRDMKDRVHGNS